MSTPVGYTWLAQHFELETAALSHRSYIGTRSRAELPNERIAYSVVEYFLQTYYPDDHPLAHIEFALKYDDLNLDLLQQVFHKLSAGDVASHIDKQPSGKYSRQIGYLYEFLTGRELMLARPIGGNYVDLLNPTKYLTAPATKNARWRINDNLLGTNAFCPMVRLTEDLRQAMDQDYSGRLEAFKNKVPPELFRRAIDYLYFKESKSSYDIERETPTPERGERFVEALKNAGRSPLDEVLSEASLTLLQNIIVEPRYAQEGYRTWQNHVGESPPGRRPIIHYICPPGEDVASLMKGLIDCAHKATYVHPIARAAVISFGFVFIHPFEDGNGRIHRYLIHDFLSRDGLVPDGMILPVSAYMLHNGREYDRTLEAYSKSIKQVVRYTINDDEVLAVTNRDAVIGSYRYPDLTPQVGYLFNAVEKTISIELIGELLFIRNYDEARKAIRAVVDLPDRKLDQIIKFLHQDNGRLSKAKRGYFVEITDDEIRRIEEQYQEAFRANESLDAFGNGHQQNSTDGSAQ